MLLANILKKIDFVFDMKIVDSLIKIVITMVFIGFNEKI